MPMLPCDLEPLYRLLTCVTDNENALVIANSLMEIYGSMERIFSCHISELKREIPGSAEFKSKVAFFLETVKSISRRRRMETYAIGDIYNEISVVNFLLGLYLFEPMEMVNMLFFDSKMRYIGMELISSGTVNTSHITIRRALEVSLRHNASYVVIAHNHPMGSPTPSPDDVSTTRSLASAFSETGLRLIEHFILSGASYTKILSMSSGTLRQDATLLL